MMYAVTRMGGRLLAMKTVDTLDELYAEEKEFERVQTFINEGMPVVFCEDLEDLVSLFNLTNVSEMIEVVEPK